MSDHSFTKEELARIPIHIQVEMAKVKAFDRAAEAEERAVVPIKSTTYCIDCRHLRNLEPDSSRSRIWYNHVCLASKLPPVEDFYDGTEEVRYAYCRDINHGNCPKFEGNKVRAVALGRAE